MGSKEVSACYPLDALARSARRGGMTMYCCLCGAVFERPLKIQETANHGEGMKEHGFCALCPSCGCEEPYFEEIEEGEYDGRVSL